MANDGGLSKFQRRMAAIPKAVREAAQPALERQAKAIVKTMKHLAEDLRDTGALIDSIAVTGPGESTPPYSQPGGSTVVPEGVVAVTVGNKDVRYAHLVEYGTTKAPAQPFFWPAVRLHKKKATAAIKRAIGKAVREAKS